MNVLLVEDQKNILSYWKLSFRSFSKEFALFTAESVVEARRKLESERIDIAIVDMGIPIDPHSDDPKETEDSAYHGLDLLEFLEEELGIPAFALTGTTDPEILHLIEFPLIEKPVRDFETDVIALLRKVKEC